MHALDATPPLLGMSPWLNCCPGAKGLLLAKPTPRNMSTQKELHTLLQITHDDKAGTSVSYLEYVDVSQPERVAGLLERAMRQRSVGATAMNEQSSRSHMVFMLHIDGANEGTGQKAKGAWVGWGPAAPAQRVALTAQLEGWCPGTLLVRERSVDNAVW